MAVLGWLWIVVAVVGLIWALSILVLFGVLDRFVPGSSEGMPPPPPVAVPIHWAFQHYVVAGSVVGLLSVLGIYAGVQFLRLRPWARGVLEAGGWLAVGLCFAMGLWLSQFWVALAAEDSTGFTGSHHFRFCYGLFLAAWYGVVPGVYLLLLRSRRVRGAFVAMGRPIAA